MRCGIGYSIIIEQYISIGSADYQVTLDVTKEVGSCDISREVSVGTHYVADQASSTLYCQVTSVEVSILADVECGVAEAGASSIGVAESSYEFFGTFFPGYDTVELGATQTNDTNVYYRSSCGLTVGQYNQRIFDDGVDSVDRCGGSINSQVS